MFSFRRCNIYLVLMVLLILMPALDSCLAERPASPVSSPSTVLEASIPAAPAATATGTGPLKPSPTISTAVSNYAYEIVHVYPHDPEAFTQGLAFAGGFLYEGTGLSGKSSLRKVELESGQILQEYCLPQQYFGEGIAVYREKIAQLTWQSHTGFVYNKDSFVLEGDFSYATEGWGLTFDGEYLIMSDGTASLYYLDPETFKPVRRISVSDRGIPVDDLNELESVAGKIYANVWRTDRIVIIDPLDGRAAGWIDLSGLLETQNYSGEADVFNGIAYDPETGRLWVTGKLWPFLFEIKLVNKGSA